MFKNKKTIILVLVIVLILISGAAFLFFYQKNHSSNGNSVATTGGGISTGTGTVGSLPTSVTNNGRCGSGTTSCPTGGAALSATCVPGVYCEPGTPFVDQSQPYAVNLPRTTAPVVVGTNGNGNSNSGTNGSGSGTSKNGSGTNGGVYSSGNGSGVNNSGSGSGNNGSGSGASGNGSNSGNTSGSSSGTTSSNGSGSGATGNGGTNSGTTGNGSSVAYNDGLVPDSDGNYVQTIDPSGFNVADTSQYDNSLSNQDFLNTYYPDADSYINGTDPVDQQINSTDPVVTDASAVGSDSGDGSDATTTTPVPGISAGIFNVINVTDKASLTTYINDLSTEVSTLDLNSDPTMIADVLTDLSNGKYTKVPDQKAKTEVILQQLRDQPVPSEMIGLQESYYAMYQDYDTFLNDALTLQNTSDQTATQQILGNIQNDATAVENDYTQLSTNINAAANIVSLAN